MFLELDLITASTHGREWVGLESACRRGKTGVVHFMVTSLNNQPSLVGWRTPWRKHHHTYERPAPISQHVPPMSSQHRDTDGLRSQHVNSWRKRPALSALIGWHGKVQAAPPTPALLGCESAHPTLDSDVKKSPTSLCFVLLQGRHL